MGFTPDYKELLAREKVNLRSQRDVELWTEALDIYTADLVLAISQVGEAAASVFNFIQANGIAGSRSRTPPPSPRIASEPKS